MAKPVSKGDAYELRLARLFHVEGAFVRRAIDLNMRFGEDVTVTDLDILALRFAGDFRISRTIGESKTAQGKKGPKIADRLLWLVGLRDLVQADSAFVATARNASDKVRGLAERLQIDVIDEQDLAHRERQHELDESSPWGPFDPQLLERQREVYNDIKSDTDLKRVYWFVRSEFWLSDPTAAIKRAFGAVRLLAKAWDAQSDKSQRPTLLWLARQTQINIVVGLVTLAGSSYRQVPDKSGGRLLRELASGPGLDFDTLLRVSGEVDRYVTAILHELDADPGRHVSALGAFNPTPPSYAESLVEVVERLAAEPESSIQLPRFVDVKVAEVELDASFDELQVKDDVMANCERLLRLIGTFLVGQLKVDPSLLAGVLNPSQKKDNNNELTREPTPSPLDQRSEGERSIAGRLFDQPAESLELM